MSDHNNEMPERIYAYQIACRRLWLPYVEGEISATEYIRAKPGYQYVPIEPTTAMIDACDNIETYRDDFGSPCHMSYGQASDAWAAMLAASKPGEGG
jgi:hypothetical protein